MAAVLQDLGQESFEHLVSMFVFDALIVNTDRHLANFGVLRDNVSGKAVALAPVFDNGRSLFFSTDDDNCTNSDLCREVLTSLPKWPGSSFNDMAARLIGDRQKEELARLEGFRFEQHPLHKNSQKRLDAIEGYIRQRARELLAMQTVDHDLLAEKLCELYPMSSQDLTVVEKQSEHDRATAAIRLDDARSKAKALDDAKQTKHVHLKKGRTQSLL